MKETQKNTGKNERHRYKRGNIGTNKDSGEKMKGAHNNERYTHIYKQKRHA